MQLVNFLKDKRYDNEFIGVPICTENVPIIRCDGMILNDTRREIAETKRDRMGGLGLLVTKCDVRPIKVKDMMVKQQIEQNQW